MSSSLLLPALRRLNLLILSWAFASLAITANASAQSELGIIGETGVREAVLFTESARAQTYTFAIAEAAPVRFLVASTGSNVTIKLFAPDSGTPFMNVNGSSMDVTLNLSAEETYRLDITGPLNGRPLVSLAIDVLESGTTALGVGGATMSTGSGSDSN